ncbi:hypothetical protein D3C80_2211650 [compost metagenome]
MVLGIQTHLRAVRHDFEQRQPITFGQGLGVWRDMLEVAVHQQAGVLQLDPAVAPLIEHF